MSLKTRLRLGAALLATVAAMIAALIMLMSLPAFGQIGLVNAVAATSQPASAPTVAVPVPIPGGAKGWLASNLVWLLPLVIFVLSTLATFLSRYPKAKGVVAAIRMFAGGLSMLEFKDGKRPGLVLKWPVKVPSPPPDPPQNEGTP